jgi:hypothetical protein
MEYQKRLAVHSIKYQFVEDNMDVVIRFLVNKYKYLLKTMIVSIPVDIDVDELNYEPVNDMVETILLSHLFPYIQQFNSKINVNKLIKNYFKRYIYEVSINSFNEKQDISSRNITFRETDLITKFKSMFSMNESYWDIPVKSFLENNGKLLGKISSCVYDYSWNKNTNDSEKKSLRDKIDKSYKKLTNNFSYFFAYGGYIDIEDTYNLTNQFISNYSKLYILYSELSKYIESDDIIMIIVSQADILDDFT